MGRELLVREMKAAALARMEDGARTEADFKNVIKQWNHNDKNRERKERYWEIGRPNEEMLHWDRINENDEKGRIKEVLEIVIPHPLEHHWWRQLMRGDFIDTIFDNPHEMWQLVEDWDISSIIKGLTHKQKQVLYLRAVRLYTAVQIARHHSKTDRAVRKLLAASLDSIRDKLAQLIREQIEIKCPKMTLAKREFLAWHDEKEKSAVDRSGNG
jgi:hypothetical protein